MERWYMSRYILDIGFLLSCRTSATKTRLLLSSASRKMTA
jgi:hypothetical protein